MPSARSLFLRRSTLSCQLVDPVDVHDTTQRYQSYWELISGAAGRLYIQTAVCRPSEEPHAIIYSFAMLLFKLLAPKSSSLPILYLSSGLVTYAVRHPERELDVDLR